MMIDYIMRLDALIDVCIGCNEEFPNEPCEPNDCKIKRALSGIPIADVLENVKGKWIIKTDGFVIKRVWGVCSECGNTLDFSGVNAGRGDANFCPNCGADMRGDNDV